MSTTAIAIIVIIIIIFLYLYWRYRGDPLEEQFQIAQDKLDKVWTYNSYQGHAIGKCQSCVGSNRMSTIDPADQARLISISELNTNLGGRISEMNGALIDIRTMQQGNSGKRERIALIIDTLDNMWDLQCGIDKKLVRLGLFPKLRK